MLTRQGVSITGEAKFKGVANVTTKILGLQHLFRDLAISMSQAPLFYYDNIGATYLSSNPIFQARMKQVEVDFHFVHRQVQNKTLRVAFISNKDQPADIFMKPLTIARFLFICSSLCLYQLLLVLRRDVKDYIKAS